MGVGSADFVWQGLGAILPICNFTGKISSKLSSLLHVNCDL